MTPTTPIMTIMTDSSIYRFSRHKKKTNGHPFDIHQDSTVCRKGSLPLILVNMKITQLSTSSSSVEAEEGGNYNPRRKGLRRHPVEIQLLPSSSLESVETNGGDGDYDGRHDLQVRRSALDSFFLDAQENDASRIPVRESNMQLLTSSSDGSKFELLVPNEDLDTSQSSSSSFLTYIRPVFDLIQSAYWTYGWTSLVYIALGVIFLLLSLPWTSILFYGIPLFALYKLVTYPPNKTSSRSIKWTVPSFPDKLRNGGLFLGPTFQDEAGVGWVLFLLGKRSSMDGGQVTLGLMVVDIPEEVGVLMASSRFICTNAMGVKVAPAMGDLQLKPVVFKRPGDYALTQPFMLNGVQFRGRDTLIVCAKVDLKAVKIGIWRSSLRWLTMEAGKKRNNSTNNEQGRIFQERLSIDNAIMPGVAPLSRFVSAPETQTFVWEIPNISMKVKNGEDVWGFTSPLFYFPSENFISIWRMKLIEISGVFRLHVQLRGLPSRMEQTAVWILVQLVDASGASVIPDDAVSKVKYPDFFNLWDTSRLILFRKETILSRFIISPKDSLKVRLSLQVRRNEVPLAADSDLWIS